MLYAQHQGKIPGRWWQLLPLILICSFLFFSICPIHALAQDPDNSFGQLSMEANAARLGGDIQHAIDLYARGVKADPRWQDGWWYLGSLQYATNAYDPAITSLTHYISLVPKAGPAFALRGLCEFEIVEYPQALQDLQEAVKLGAADQPRNAGIIFYHEALLLTRFGRYEEALAKYGAILKHGVATDQIVDGIGLAALRMPVMPQEVDPEQHPLVSLAGQAAADVMSGNPDVGVMEFQRLFQSYPTTRNLHYSLGYLLSTSDPYAAIMQMKQELQLAPSSAVVHSMLAWILGMQGDYIAALPEARKSVDEDPTLPMAQLVLGRDLVEAGDMEGALPHLQAVLKLDPANLEAHLALAKAYSKMGRKDDARRERFLCLALSDKQIVANANM